MNKIDISYGLYITLPEEKKRDYLFLVDFCKFDGEKLKEDDYIYEKPLSELQWGKVKTFMSLYIAGDTGGIMKEIMQEEGMDRILNMEAWKVVLSFRKMLRDIESLINIENNTLVSQFPSDFGGLIEQVDFSMFSQEYIQLNDLAGGDITKFEEIRKMPYKDCFVQLLYIFKNNEFQKLVTKSMTK